VTRDLQPTYSWNVAGDALDYYLWIDGPSGNLYKQWIPASSICSGNSCSTRPQLTLSDGAYKFWVQGRNGKGPGPWSPEKNFTVVTLVPPAQPLTESPEGTLYSDLPTYAWKPVSNTVEYYLWINGPLGNVFKQFYPVTGTLCTSTTCSIKPALVLKSGPHVWWLQPSNSAGDGPWSAGKNFTVVKPTARPAVVALISPSGAIADSSPVYSWKATAQTDEYQFWLDGPSGNLLQPWVKASSVCSGTTCSFKPALTLSEGAYTFKVRAKNGLGLGNFSSTMSFRYSPFAAPPGAVTLVSPKGNISSSLPTYTWNKLASSTEYYLWINGPSGNIFKQWYPSTASLCPGATCSVKPNLSLALGAYTWWIQTKNSAGDGLWSQAVSMTVQTSDATAPTVSLSAPAPGAVVSGTLSVSATASDNVGVKGVQFLLDGQNLGAEDVSAPFAVSWNTTSASNASHTLSARARDAAGNQKTSSAVSVTVQNKDTTPPTVSIAAPLSGSTVSGTISVSANASDNVGVAGVQFRIDGHNLGAEDTQSPFSVTWNTGSVAEGSHIVSAIARDAAGNPTSSAPISVTVSRVAVPGSGWTQLPNTKLRSVCPPNGFGGSGYNFSSYCNSVTSAWNSAVFDTRRNRLIVWGGGHADYLGNELYSLDVNSSSVSRLTDPGLPIPSSPGDCPAEAIAGGTQPGSRHTYDALAYLENEDRMFVFGGGNLCGNFSSVTWTYSFGDAKWERRNSSGTIPRAVPGIVSAYDSASGDVYLHDDRYLYRYDYSTDNYERLSGSNGIDYHMTGAIDPVRRKFVIVGAGSVYVYDISTNSNYTQQTLNTTGGNDVVNSFYAGLAYHPPSGKVVAWNGGDTVYSLDLNTATWTSTSPPGGPGPALVNGTYKRWSYSPASNAFVVVNSVDSDAYRFTFSSSDTNPPVVSITSPAPAQVLADTIGLSATATDNVGIVGVQFKVDGNNVGAEDTATPYSVPWNTLLAVNGTHQVTAVARDAAGNQKASSVVTVTVMNNPGTQPSPAQNTLIVYNTAGMSQTNRPVSIGRPFREGEITNCVRATVNGASVTTQSDAKNRWPDGSLKFAIVSFVVPSIANGGSVSVEFSNQASCNNTGFLTEADMLAAGYDFDVDLSLIGGTTRTVSARAMLDAGAFRYWLRGPVVTSVLIEDRSSARTYDMDFGDGSKALHPIFEARFYPATNDVEVGVSVENTWASSTVSKGMRDLTYSVDVNQGHAMSTDEFMHPNFNHIGLSRWVKWFWLGTDPGATNIDHNLRYLTSTRAIANYDTTITVAPSLLAAWESSWVATDKTFDGTTNGIGNYSKAMGQAGASPWIGLLSTWEMVYLYTMDPQMYQAVLGNADLAGRVPFHFREADSMAGTGDTFLAGTSVETLGRIVSIDARETVTLTDLAAVSGGTYAANKINTGTINADGWGISIAHYPSFAFLAYLSTGRYWYMEETQYSGAYIAGNKTGGFGGDYARQGSAGYINFTNVRGDAWGLKALLQAAFVSPDGEPEQAYFRDKVANNLAMWEGVQNVTLTDSARATHWNWGRTMRSGNPYWQSLTNQQPSPIGQWSHGISDFVQTPLKSDGSLEAATSPWEEHFMLVNLGMAKQYGYDTSNLLRFMAPFRLEMALGANSNVYLIEAYRWPTVSSQTSQWIQSVQEFPQYFEEVPTSWRSLTADHSYRFIALAAFSYLYDIQVSSYSGKDAWEKLWSLSPDKQQFQTDSPKWAILPYK
jgi:hypothetical protein